MTVEHERVSQSEQKVSQSLNVRTAITANFCKVMFHGLRTQPHTGFSRNVVCINPCHFVETVSKYNTVQKGDLFTVLRFFLIFKRLRTMKYTNFVS